MEDADEINWNLLSASDKGRYYRNWTSDPAIGGVVSRYMEAGAVRTYIKDAVMKVYSRDRQADVRGALTRLGFAADAKITRTYIKPHGVKLADGKIVCWGPSKGWKVILMAVHERSFEDVESYPFGVVLFDASAGFGDVTATSGGRERGNKSRDT